MTSESHSLRQRLRTPRAAPSPASSSLWFVGVLRDRIGELDDRFFATVFLGSALLCLAMTLAAAAVAGRTPVHPSRLPSGIPRGVPAPSLTVTFGVTTKRVPVWVTIGA